MFNFWYSPRCTRPIKLSIIMSTCVVVFMASTQVQLSVILTGFSLALGIVLHFIRVCTLQNEMPHPDKKGLQRVLWGIPMVGIVLLSLSLTAKDLISFFVLWIQLIGFIGIGFFLVSTVEQREKRHA